MKKVTQAELAKLCGVSRQAISDAIKNKRLRKISEEKRAGLDLHDVLTVEYMKVNRQRATAINTKKVNESNVSTSNSLDDEAKEIARSRDLLRQKYIKDSGQSDNKDPDDSDYYDYGKKSSHEVNKIKVQTQKLELEVAQKMNVLVDRELVQTAFNKMYSVIYNYFHTLGDRIAPVSSNLCKCTDREVIFQIKAEIDLEVMRGLREFKRVCEGEL